MTVGWTNKGLKINVCERREGDKDAVTHFINAWPDNSYVNTIESATVDEAVFSMSSAPSNCRNGTLFERLLDYATILPIEVCFLCSPCLGYITRIPPRE
jgi:hypothetical protein